MLECKVETSDGLTCRTEEEGLGLSQVLVHLVGDGHLGVGEGAEGLLVGGAHLRLNVVEQQGERPAAERPNLESQSRSLRR